MRAEARCCASKDETHTVRLFTDLKPEINHSWSSLDPSLAAINNAFIDPLPANISSSSAKICEKFRINVVKRELWHPPTPLGIDIHNL